MLIGIISDIHANITALKEVLRHLTRFSIDELWCTGDLVGYYTFPKECISLLMFDHTPFIVKGNHDQAVATGIIPDYLSYNAAISDFWTSQKLSKNARRMIYSLPTMKKLERSQKKILLMHGGFEYPLDEYFSYNKPDLDNYIKFMELVDLDYVFLGHTHIPFQYTSRNRTIVTSGSVGQPRDGDPRACYTLFDTESGKISFNRVKYDQKLIIQGIKDHNLPEELANRLLIGE